MMLTPFKCFTIYLLCTSLIVRHNHVRGSYVCDEGWILSDRKCFYYGTDAVTWDQANSACQGQNAKLAENIIEPPEQNTGTFWIGLSDTREDGVFTWNSGEPLTISNWISGSTGISQYDDCVTLYSNTIVSGWKIKDCQSLHAYMCEKSVQDVCFWIGEPNQSVIVTNWTGENMDDHVSVLSTLDECDSSNFYICESNAQGCTPPNGCDPNAACQVINGDEICNCNNGYTGDGTVCTDIDECSDSTDECSENAKCENTAGSFNCICNWGLKADGSSCVSQLDYMCHPDDSINVFNLPEDSYIFAIQTAADGTEIMCTMQDVNATTVTITGCSKDKNVIITYGTFSGIETYKIHGGTNVVIVKLVCVEITDDGVSHSISVSYSSQLDAGERISINPVYKVTSSLSTTSTTTGNPIIWTITFPETYFIEVTSCTAYPGSDDASDNNVSLISKGGCPVIMDLISHFTTHSNGTATARLYAFKFYSYESVFLKCALKVCPSASVPEACETTCSREKRSVHERASRRPRSVVPVTISNVLYVTESYMYSSGTTKLDSDCITMVMVIAMILWTRHLLAV